MFRKVLLFLVLCGFCAAKEPNVLYLSVMGNPSYEMGVHWWTEGEASSSLWCREEGEEWLLLEGSARRLGKSDRFVHTVHIGGLEAGKKVFFRVAEEEHFFETAPARKGGGMRFAVGGDCFVSQGLMEEMNQAVAKKDPLFVVLGGDLAYTKGSGRSIFLGEKWEIGRWETFLRLWGEQLVGEGGRMIPIVPVVGNHDVPRWSGNPRIMDTLFYQIFPMDLSYRSIAVGDFFRFFLLNSGHGCAVEGAQTEWLKQALAEAVEPFQAAVYHVGAYPGTKKGQSAKSKLIRDTWTPLFEASRVAFAFEHHVHVYKRTHPILKGKVDPNGVVYFGDGCWGAPPRGNILSNKDTWYIAEAKRSSCVYLVTVAEEGVSVLPFNHKGETIDEVSLFTPVSLIEE